MAALAAAAFAGLANAHEFKAGDLTIGHPYAVETPATAKSAAGYFEVTNAGAAPDRLVAIEADFPKVEVHTTETDAAGVSRMIPVEAVEIPAGGTVTLAPRGLHVMFMGLTAPWKAGEHVAATLVFEAAGEVPIVFNVQERKPGEDGGMGGMDHGGAAKP
jgi:copper(I)-binding protein